MERLRGVKCTLYKETTRSKAVLTFEESHRENTVIFLEMGLTRGYLISLLLYISVVNEIRLPTVTCQDEEGSQCIPKKAFLVLLRLPEFSSNLAAYSRTARVIQDSKSRNDMAHLKALSSEEGDDSEICIPSSLYLELFRDPAMRGHLSVIGRTQKLPDFPRRLFDDTAESDPEEPIPDSQKRSLATLAKNDDLPISIRDRNQGEDDEEKRSVAQGEGLDALIRTLLDEESEDTSRDYQLEPGLREYRAGKRNVGTLARDFALPTGRRTLASLARNQELPSGKRNIGSLARNQMLPLNGKRNVASLARSYSLPPSGKRNIASVVRDYGMPYGKRYIGALARTGDLPSNSYDDKRSLASLARAGALPFNSYDEKRNLASLARTGDLPFNSYDEKRNLASLARTGDLPYSSYDEKRSLASLARSGDLPFNSYDDKRSIASLAKSGDFPFAEYDEKRSLASLARNDDWPTKRAKGPVFIGAYVRHLNRGPLPLLPSSVYDQLTKNIRKDANVTGRSKRQIDFSDEYPMPVMQNANVLDYEEMMEALTGQYPNAEKRFMAGTAPEMQADDTRFDYPEKLQPSKRHIGALARLGWLPSFRAARFSRSPRYLIGRENPADGQNYSSDYSSNSSAWSSKPDLSSKARYVQALHGDCRHGFKRFLLLPPTDNFLRQKLYTSPRSM
ncbi:hypothetical protein KM043_016333 [Ampulex compressa]|nr:hypothetical protein KM043_016333 [Ampulex compressa]